MCVRAGRADVSVTAKEPKSNWHEFAFSAARRWFVVQPVRPFNTEVTEGADALFFLSYFYFFGSCVLLPCTAAPLFGCEGQKYNDEQQQHKNWPILMNKILLKGQHWFLCESQKAAWAYLIIKLSCWSTAIISSFANYEIVMILHWMTTCSFTWEVKCILYYIP